MEEQKWNAYLDRYDETGKKIVTVGLKEIKGMKPSRVKDSHSSKLNRFRRYMHANPLYVVDKIKYVTLEIAPSKYTSNKEVKWLINEFSNLFKPLRSRFSIEHYQLHYCPELSIWWEVYINKQQVKFYITLPDTSDYKQIIRRQILKVWKQATVNEVENYMPVLNPEITDIVKLELQNDPLLSLKLTNQYYSSLDTLLDMDNYLKDDDKALLQIGMKPLSPGWNDNAMMEYETIKETGTVPRKKGKDWSVKEVAQQLGFTAGLVAEELMNVLGSFVIPGWEENYALKEMNKKTYGEGDNLDTRYKIRSKGFKSDIRLVAECADPEKRKSILHALSAGFDPLEGENKFIENLVPNKKKATVVKSIWNRTFTADKRNDILCSLELAKIINVPDQKAQVEYYNKLKVVTARSEVEVPREIFIKDGVPFCQYMGDDGKYEIGYFASSNPDLFCRTHVVIGEPGSGKTTFAINFAVESFNQGFGSFVIDVADGVMINKILDRITPEQRKSGKIKIIDLTNGEFPIGLGLNEAFISGGGDAIEDLMVEEILDYIALVSETELNMRAKQWVENAIRAVFVTPDATLQDVENMLNNVEYRAARIPTITDPQLKADWEHFHNQLSKKDRALIYEEAFRRLAPVMRKKGLKSFVLQKPKKDKEGNYLLDFRKWMDEGYLVLIKANEPLTQSLQTALVSFLLVKINLAVMSREDTKEKDRHPCFVILDEPDHYIKGSEKWRGMLTRYRKYHCGLILMFHGWKQLTKVDKDLPAIIRESGPHYVIFQTDLQNLLELKEVIEPDFLIKDLVKGMPLYHAVIKLKMYTKKGEPVPAFMAKSIDEVKKRYKYYDNSDLYDICAKELGCPKQDVLDELFRYKTGEEFSGMEVTDVDYTIEDDEEKVAIKKKQNFKIAETKEEQEEEEDRIEKDRIAKMTIEYEVGNFLTEQSERGEEPDEDLLLHADELLEDGDK